MIRRVEDDAGLAAVIALRERIDPLTATTVDDQRSFLTVAEAPLVLLAEEGFGSVMRFPGEPVVIVARSSPSSPGTRGHRAGPASATTASRPSRARIAVGASPGR